MMHKVWRKASFAELFTVISLTIIVLITVSASVMFFISFRSLSYTQIETNTKEKLDHIRDTVVAKFSQWSALVRQTAVAATPIMATEAPDEIALHDLFWDIMATQTEVVLIYCSGNISWYEPGGFAAFSTDWRPDTTWDNTIRTWFTGAKAKSGQISYAAPYVDAATGNLTTAISINVYDKQKGDVGIVSGNVSIGFLEHMLNEKISAPEQHIYFLNKQGLFVTNPDSNAVLKKDFFTETGLDRYRDAVLSSESFFKMDQKVFIYAVSIPEVDWLLVSTIPTSVIFAKANSLLIKLIIVNLLLMGIVVAISIILTRILKNERDEITAMKDNPRVGFFLMDRTFIIQEQYSAVLEQMLSTTDLKGKNFTDLLAASLKTSERDGVKDYFTMMFEHSFDQAMLDDINPLQELSYTSLETGEQKTLSCDFATVERGKSKTLILGNIHDITTEKEIQKQLEQEETKRDEEMRSLFEVIQVDPRVFGDFIEDVDYEFDRINTILKNRELSSQEAMVEIYQAVHAIKSNAIILGLEEFSGKVHELESKIKEWREQAEISFDDLFQLTIELEDIMKEKEKFSVTIDKIHAFKVGETRKQHDHILIEALKRASNRAAEDLGKKVRFEVEELEVQALEQGPRRVIKEVLTQLVRNAVCHGIESPDERHVLGKEEVGVIRLLIKVEDGNIHIKLQDDGKGLDFARIREKAEQLNLLRGDEEDKNQLSRVLFAPGFSTAEQEGLHAGRGIGLNLVRDRVRGVNGSIKLQTEWEKGTAFHIYIPLVISIEVNQAS